MSGLASRTRRKPSVAPGMPWFMTIAFMRGSFERETIWEIVVSCSAMKFGG